MFIETKEDIDRYCNQVQKASADTRQWLMLQPQDPLDLLCRMKFEKVGSHPIEGHALNLVEQIHQTWTYIVALAATRLLLDLHPKAGGYHLAPGADASIDLDIMSVDGLVGAETFAAVDPKNNDKLKKDLKKMSLRSEMYRYIFFMSPCFPSIKHLEDWDSNGVQVWSVDISQLNFV